MTERKNPMHLKTIIKLPALPNIQAVKILEQAEASIYLSVELNEPVTAICSTCSMAHHAQTQSIG
jgi:hypothetical protein